MFQAAGRPVKSSSAAIYASRSASIVVVADTRPRFSPLLAGDEPLPLSSCLKLKAIFRVSLFLIRSKLLHLYNVSPLASNRCW